MLSCNLEAHRFYPYRHAFADAVFMSFELDEDWEFWESTQLERFHKQHDNHTTFLCQNNIAVTFHDCKVYIGFGVRPMDSEIGSFYTPVGCGTPPP